MSLDKASRIPEYLPPNNGTNLPNMNKFSTPKFLGAFVVAGLMTAPAKAQDCNLTITVEYGCVAEDLGWAAVTIEEGTAIAPWEYLWSNGATTQSQVGISAMNESYWVMVTDAAGCTDKIDFILDCTKEDEDCQLRTQTQGGWGTSASGNNPGAYRDANFAMAFPMGLTIGCTNTLQLTTSAAVDAFLPSGTTARALNAGNMVNPGQTYKNVLAGQLVAATLSVGFDAYDEDFGAGSSLLGDATINSGTFAGWTVNQLLQEANNFIGGCASSYTATQLNTALTMINENYVDGTTNNGFLDCSPGTKKDLRDAVSDDLSIFPNPATDRISIEIGSIANGTIAVTMIDAVGRTISTTSQVNMNAGERRTINLDVNELNNGYYFVNVTRNGETIKVQRVVVSH
jgi:hypothetical protein